jgi:hypothetical protein
MVSLRGDVAVVDFLLTISEMDVFHLSEVYGFCLFFFFVSFDVKCSVVWVKGYIKCNELSLGHGCHASEISVNKILSIWNNELAKLSESSIEFTIIFLPFFDGFG